jgi:deoxycytidylate deaminase
MALRFSGSFDELKNKLVKLESAGSWAKINENQEQYRDRSGGVMNWFPSTGSLNFQGRPPARDALEALVTITLRETNVATPAQTRTAEQREIATREMPSEPADVKKLNVGTSLRTYSDSELIIGLVGAVGTEMSEVVSVLEDRLKTAGYTVHKIRVSEMVIPKLQAVDVTDLGEADRIKRLMDAGDEARRTSGDNGILASGVAAEISALRSASRPPLKRTAFIVNSLKHPEEALRLRQIYPRGFYLLGVYPDERVRTSYWKRKNVRDEDVVPLIERDQDEQLKFGQRVDDTFHLSDFFVRLEEGSRLTLENSLLRIFDILFGDPYKTPTFDEFAMFLAFTASLRSADLSRQVGAVVAKYDEILATGANDCPKFGGGLYWPKLDSKSHAVEDKPDGRDYKLGEDSNKVEQAKIIKGILEKAAAIGIDKEKLKTALEQSRIRDLTEYGRVVHAEMEALLSCARNNISTRDAELFCTTFPCHNCAKHIIAAGIKRVVFIEPYQKSKAVEFHTDSISVGFGPAENTVRFEPFVGVGPRRFFDLFSVKLGAGYPLERKDEDGIVIEWALSNRSKLRVQMQPGSYLDLELEAKEEFDKHKR